MFDYKVVQREPLQRPEFFDLIRSDGTRIHIDSGGNITNTILDNEPGNIRSKGCATSKARAEYKTEKIKSVTVSGLDRSKIAIDSTDNFTSLKQLLVDLSAQDDAAYAKENRCRSEMEFLLSLMMNLLKLLCSVVLKMLLITFLTNCNLIGSRP